MSEDDVLESQDYDSQRLAEIREEMDRATILVMDEPANWDVVDQWIAERVADHNGFDVVRLHNPNGINIIALGNTCLGVVDECKSIVIEISRKHVKERRSKEKYLWN